MAAQKLPDKGSSTITSDPGIPGHGPFKTYWKYRIHPLANIQSLSLPESTDFAIVGSGITGLGVCKTLLETCPTKTVTVLEACSLCSGATGSDCGLFSVNTGETYISLARLHGAQTAGDIIRFNFRNLQQLAEFASRHKESEPVYEERSVLRVFFDSRSFEAARKSIMQLEEDHHSLRDIFTIVDARTVENCYGVYGAVGGMKFPGGIIRPYPLVTETFRELVAAHGRRFSLETYTPVLSVTFEPQSNPSHPYCINTPRGALRAATVAYCINAYSQHLIPGVDGLITPQKFTMTVQDPDRCMRRGSFALSWGSLSPTVHNQKNRDWSNTLHYLLQSAKTGYMYFGCADVCPYVCISSANNNTADHHSVFLLQEKLSCLLRKVRLPKWPLVSVWSGLMGCSFDGLPIVGKLPSSLTQRDSDSEWIAAAFNGYGMANCLLSGEALARMMVGEDVSSWFPEAYRISYRRFNNLWV
ncbi:NAD(P)/FAD-dependent oxidoreductase [Aspergillus tanneri]|uniref:FAD dependent oxidoreductase domain-containing protein n=1 Tax=Aspergillus tanneri TaxID=1220188 RepID=A0A5M9MHG3_9EURO|nr:uncharacterized protein ATNIH1004_006665 [Aspergillus tanneri]KAA8645246.1 hypothetical protein ATNIH1004_006665 [Aspergillus tanneri]